VPEKQLTLVGLSLQKDFERLCLGFPDIVEIFSGWIDLSALMKAVSPTPTTVNTGVGTALRVFRYPYGDTGFNCRHQASNDAVMALAVLRSPTDLDDITNLVLRQHEFAGIEIAIQTDHSEPMVYRSLLNVDGRDLATSIDSAQKLAFAFQVFKPIGVAADCSNANDRGQNTSIRTPRRTLGCVCFKSNTPLQYFISTTNGQKHDGTVLNVVRAPLLNRIQAQISKGKNLKRKRANRLEKRARELTKHVASEEPS
jgi:hypothetical protein